MRERLIKISMILVLLFIVFSIYFIYEGLTKHVLPKSELRWSQQKWNEGQYMESVKWFVASYQGAYNAGLRWFIADFYLQRMGDLYNQSKLAEALEDCYRAVKILDGHDDEGVISYRCVTIEQEMLKQK